MGPYLLYCTVHCDKQKEQPNRVHYQLRAASREVRIDRRFRLTAGGWWACSIEGVLIADENFCEDWRESAYVYAFGPSRSWSITRKWKCLRGKKIRVFTPTYLQKMLNGPVCWLSRGNAPGPVVGQQKSYTQKKSKKVSWEDSKVVLTPSGGTQTVPETKEMDVRRRMRVGSILGVSTRWSNTPLCIISGPWSRTMERPLAALHF